MAPSALTKEEHMKHLKMLGLAAVAALALIAFVGVTSASATVLCSTISTPCNSKWAKGTQLEFILKPETTARWVTGMSVNECKSGTMKATMSNQGGATEAVKLPMSASDFSWNECTFNQSTLEGGELEISSIAGSNNGVVTIKGFRFQTETQFYGNCTYTAGTGTKLGTLTASGSGQSIIDIEVVLTKKEGSITCPTTMEWWEEWIQTAPKGKALYVEPS
jgi:hypothetical protein